MQSRNQISCVVFFLGMLLMSCGMQKRKSFSDGGKDYIQYYLRMYEADSLFIVKEYKKSHDVLKDLFSAYKPVNLEVYAEYETYIASCVAIGDTSDIRRLVMNSFVEYGSRLEDFRNDSLLSIALRESRYSEHELDGFRKQYISGLDLSLRDTIAEMVRRDQEVRKGGTVNAQSLKDADNANKSMLSYLIQKDRFPSLTSIGGYAVDQRDVDLRAVLLHTDPDFRMDFLLPKIATYVRSGRCVPELYAAPYDRFLIEFRGHKQLYGSYFKTKGELMPLVNAEKLDSIRRSIGLPRIHYAQWRMVKKYGIDPYN